MPLSKEDYYKVLQVDSAADPDIIAVAYKRLALKYHPDTNPSPDATRRAACKPLTRRIRSSVMRAPVPSTIASDWPRRRGLRHGMTRHNARTRSQKPHDAVPQRTRKRGASAGR